MWREGKEDMAKAWTNSERNAEGMKEQKGEWFEKGRIKKGNKKENSEEKAAVKEEAKGKKGVRKVGPEGNMEAARKERRREEKRREGSFYKDRRKLRKGDKR